ncbi:hypothetical protein [Candidatus Leptofilum sp.]|uniref:hypothetical protein n=1 Tax=Candidatus Leptofilum sp. TaxID=3241576 RepID=UPI003B5CEA2F
MTLEQQIAAWDGKTAAPLEEIYQSQAATPDFIPVLLLLIATESTQSGATWLLKYHTDAGNLLPPEILEQIYAQLPSQTQWDAKLHLLQCFPKWPMPETALSSIHPFLHSCLKAQSKFVRAWVYSGFYTLAHQHPQFQAEAQALLAQAHLEEAASIKARIRQTYKIDAASSRPFLEQPE